VLAVICPAPFRQKIDNPALTGRIVSFLAAPLTAQERSKIEYTPALRNRTNAAPRPASKAADGAGSASLRAMIRRASSARQAEPRIRSRLDHE
jgi:hypothetical protein